MKVTAAEALSVTVKLLEDGGASDQHACLQAHALVEAELRGHPSHGLQRLPRLLSRLARSLIAPNATGEQNWANTGFLRVEGQNGLGPVVAEAAIQMLIPRVAETGIAVAGVRNANHLGMLAIYAERIARAGLIGIVLSGSEALVHPYGGDKAMLGTNPIAIGVPTAREPFVLDLATSVVSMGKIHAFASRGDQIPNGWALDSAGTPTNDPHVAKSGSLTPFGGAKGYGLGLGFELLVASLAGSALAPEVRGTLDAEHIANKGDVFIIAKPGGGSVTSALTAYLDSVRASGDGVLVPGDRSRQRRLIAMSEGFEVEPRLWEELVSACSDLPASVRTLNYDHV